MLYAVLRRGIRLTCDVLFHQPDFLQDFSHHGFHIGQFSADHPGRYYRTSTLVTQFRKGVQRLNLLVIVIADTDNLRFQKGQLLGDICFL